MADWQQLGRCRAHGWGYACEDCGFDTDASGFAVGTACGAVPLRPVRRCDGCDCLCAPAVWNHKDWFHCVFCVPRGELSRFSRDLEEFSMEALEAALAEKKDPPPA